MLGAALIMGHVLGYITSPTPIENSHKQTVKNFPCKERARKLGRCDSYLQNLKTLLTD